MPVQMKAYDLKFSDGKGCRYLAAQTEESEEDELAGLKGIFGDRLVSMSRIIPPAPAKLPWKRKTANTWMIDLFVLARLPDGSFRCSWPGGEVFGGKDEVSSAVRANWHLLETWGNIKEDQ